MARLQVERAWMQFSLLHGTFLLRVGRMRTKTCVNRRIIKHLPFSVTSHCLFTSLHLLEDKSLPSSSPSLVQGHSVCLPQPLEVHLHSQFPCRAPPLFLQRKTPSSCTQIILFQRLHPLLDELWEWEYEQP